jgi:hypothetical protein
MLTSINDIVCFAYKLFPFLSNIGSGIVFTLNMISPGIISGDSSPSFSNT